MEDSVTIEHLSHQGSLLILNHDLMMSMMFLYYLTGLKGLMFYFEEYPQIPLSVHYTYMPLR